MVEHLPLAQGMVPNPGNQVPCWAPCMEPASLSICVSASLCVSLMNKINIFFLKKRIWMQKRPRTGSFLPLSNIFVDFRVCLSPTRA